MIDSWTESSDQLVSQRYHSDHWNKSHHGFPSDLWPIWILSHGNAGEYTISEDEYLSRIRKSLSTADRSSPSSIGFISFFPARQDFFCNDGREIIWQWNGRLSVDLQKSVLARLFGSRSTSFTPVSLCRDVIAHQCDLLRKRDTRVKDSENYPKHPPIDRSFELIFIVALSKSNW